MIDVINNKYFNLYNESFSYLLYIMDNGQLGHLYYGDSLGKIDENTADYIAYSKNKASGTVKYSPDLASFTLADHMQEYPTYGTSDYREGAISLSRGDEVLYPDFKFKSYKITHGQKRDLAMPQAYGDDCDNLIITLVDEEKELTLDLTYTIFPELTAVVRKAEITNNGKDSIEIQNLQSNVLSLPDSNYDFLQLSGAWLKERHIKKRPLEQGITKIESLRGASSHQENPFAALVARDATNDTGRIYASNLIYSGNFITQAEVDEWGICRLMSGINPATFTWRLNSGEHFTSPEGAVFYTNSGYNGLMRQTHAFARDHVIDSKWKTKKRPIVINNWEATYFDFNEEKLVSLAKRAADLGAECFVLDDGWFGHRDTDRTSLGNWIVDKKKFPNGLAHFSDYVHQLGMQFGLWFEPEMVSPDTELYKKHPDWVVRHPYKRASIGRGQYVLDFANPAVVDNIYHQMLAILSSVKIDYIKWDMNRNITEAYSSYLKKLARLQGEFFHRYILGVYDLYSRLLKKFPDLLIEGCAGGGGRFDLGILYYSPQIWPSDDSDAVERLDIMTGTLLAYPLSTFSNHVSAVPNDQVKRMTSLNFRQDVTCFGPLGYELDLNKLSQDELNKIKANISWYKKNREILVQGDFYQILPVGTKNNTYAWAVSRNNQQIVGFYRKLARPNETLDHYLPLKDLNEKTNYLINGKQKLSGKVLQTFGLREPYQFNGSNLDTAQLIGDFQSYIYQINSQNI